MSPAMKGLGYGQIFVAFCIVSYYCSLMALTVYYLIASFQSILPWSYCRDEWGGHCVDASSNITNFGNETFSSSAELYFRKIVLNEIDSIEKGLGIPSWSLLLCLLFSWLCMFGIMSRGVKTSGKAVYFLAIFPYVVMIILLIRAVTLSGAFNGIYYFVYPKWEELLKPKVWYAAITQCFFSLGVCLSPIISYSSHNNFNHPLSRDIMIITTLDTFTSLMAGCTIFGILGNLAHEMGTNDVSKVVRGGSGLAFISYPDALSRFSVVPQFFSALFFFMMFVLGAGSAVALHTSITDVALHCCSKQKKWIIILGTCIIGFLSGIIYTTPGGQWFVTLVDYYGGTCIAIIIGVIEIITIFWIYGLYNFLNDAEFMLGIRPGFYWRICWCILTPLLMIVILFYTFATYEPVKYNDLLFPSYAYAIGWCIFAVGVLLIVYFIIREIRKNKDVLILEAIKSAFKPKNWGPLSSETRGKWEEFTAERKINRKRGLFELFFR
ncbi:sodium-dependent nutrient amino acid transporter 1-like isoform X2 [Leptopilina heterotoma]|nr:sodium-dependent nutrient amino acid transporter 1-like isoform X2 [Leptopilina heterotoma]